MGKPRKRGRPAGRTAEGEATRALLYSTAIDLIGERGYEAATLRDVATRAGVSPALLYRYFPSKRSVVLALYEDLSERFAQRAAVLPRGRWHVRFMRALALSLETLGPHRLTLRALAPILVGHADEGVLAQNTAFSRVRVQAVFRDAVAGAADAPKPPFADALARLLYVVHLGVILWWLLDRSPRQRATDGLLALTRRTLPSAALALRLRPVRTFVQTADGLVEDALLGAHTVPSTPHPPRQ